MIAQMRADVSIASAGSSVRAHPASTIRFMKFYNVLYIFIPNGEVVARADLQIGATHPLRRTGHGAQLTVSYHQDRQDNLNIIRISLDIAIGINAFWPGWL